MNKLKVYEKDFVNTYVRIDVFINDLTTTHESLRAKGVEDVFVEYDSSYPGCVVLYGDRLETDEECNARILKDAEKIEDRKNNLKSALIDFSKECPKEFKELLEEI